MNDWAILLIWISLTLVTIGFWALTIMLKIAVPLLLIILICIMWFSIKEKEE